MGSLFGVSSYLSISQTWIKMVKIQRTCMAPIQCPSFVYVEPTDEEPEKEVLFTKPEFINVFTTETFIH